MPGYHVHDLNPFLIQFNESIGIRWYGVAYVLAFVVGICLVRHLSRRGWCDIPEAKVSDFIIGGAIFGVLIGGRAGYMLFYDFGAFLANPLVFFKVWDGGMSAHGGILGLFLYTLWYSMRHKVSWLNIGDNLVVAAPIGIFFGRIANFINGELYGRVTSVSWAVQFPKELYEAPQETVDLAVQEAMAIHPEWNNPGAIIEAAGISPDLRIKLAGILSPRHPSQIYEAVLEGVVLFGILWYLRTRFRLPNGVLTGVFFVAYALLRSYVEMFRQPDAPLTGLLTRGQLLSIFLFVIGVAFLVAAWKRPRYPVNQPA